MDDIDEMIAGVQEGIKKACAETLAAGCWLSHIEDDAIVRVYPDGRREVVSYLAEPFPAEPVEE